MLKGAASQALGVSGQSDLVVVGATIVAFIALAGSMAQGNRDKFHSAAAIVGAWFLVALLAGMGTPESMLLVGTTFVLAILAFGTLTNSSSVSNKFFHVAAYVAVWFAVAVLVDAH